MSNISLMHEHFGVKIDCYYVKTSLPHGQQSSSGYYETKGNSDFYLNNLINLKNMHPLTSNPERLRYEFISDYCRNLESYPFQETHV